MRAVAARSQFECRIQPLVGVIRYPIDGKARLYLTNDWKNPVAYRLLILLGGQHGVVRRGRRTEFLEDNMSDFIRHLRRQLGMTQEEFAHSLGITVGTVNRWENGRFRPSKLARSTILDFARRHGVTVQSDSDVASSDKPIH
jgi:DNA-binding XRE family transcriptional regulator